MAQFPSSLFSKSVEAAAAQHDVELVGEAVQRDSGIHVEGCNQLLDRAGIGDRLDDRTLANQRSPSKYIWVISRWEKLVPNTEMWIWAGRQLLTQFRHG